MSSSPVMSPVNIVITDEPLLMMEACDKIIAQARTQGMNERKVVEASEGKFNWSELSAESGSLSLFAEIVLTDIRFTKAPLKEAQTALVDLVNNANEENRYLIRLPKLDKRQKATKWYKAISANAKVQELWPPKAHEFINWLHQRALTAKLQILPKAIERLAEQTEGNLLAARQCLDKLKLLYPQQAIDIEQVESISSDNARYSVFLCLDEALAGHGKRAVKMLHKFQQENIPPISILVNLTREIQTCHSVAIAGLQGVSPTQALAKSFLWESKKQLLVGAVKRLPPSVWQKLVIRCAFLDRMVKGQEAGDIWLEIELCLWMLAGTRIWGRKVSS
ncbi:DNA polymerase III subunit delta [Aliikangiella maris]|uniref:DNA polymerase III subunit delta n=2 Tax=Aliikangiella maris TaxID=3162458 RepID=A0ABV3MQ02_9GAMM